MGHEDATPLGPELGIGLVVLCAVLGSTRGNVPAGQWLLEDVMSSCLCAPASVRTWLELVASLILCFARCWEATAGHWSGLQANGDAAPQKHPNGHTHTHLQKLIFGTFTFV